MIKVLSSAANLNFKWKKRTGERKQTKFHQNTAFFKDQTIVTKQAMFNNLLIRLLSVAQEYTEDFSLKNMLTKWGFVYYFYINRFAEMH